MVPLFLYAPLRHFPSYPAARISRAFNMHKAAVTKTAAFPPCSLVAGTLYFLFSQVWFPTVQDVLHADWQDVWHSPHPPFFTVLFNVCVFNVLMCFMSCPPNILQHIARNIIPQVTGIWKPFFHDTIPPSIPPPAQSRKVVSRLAISP